MIPLSYEVHISVHNPDGKLQDAVKKYNNNNTISGKHAKVSSIGGDDPDLIVTANYDTHAEASEFAKKCPRYFNKEGCPVVRVKIEAILMDVLL